MKGTIKRLKDGFGFIKGQDTKEYFFHRSVVEGGAFASLREGQAVEFTPGNSAKGPRADGVQPR